MDPDGPNTDCVLGGINPSRETRRIANGEEGIGNTFKGAGKTAPITRSDDDAIIVQVSGEKPVVSLGEALAVAPGVAESNNASGPDAFGHLSRSIPTVAKTPNAKTDPAGVEPGVSHFAQVL